MATDSKVSVIQGRVLVVDLDTGTTEIETPPAGVYRAYLGGRGLAAYYLTRELKPKVDPLGPENVLCMFAGLLNGVAVTGIPKFSMAAKSPLTSAIAESEAGGYWGPALRYCGFDGIVIRGRSRGAAYLLIRDQTVSTEDAEALWSLDTKEFQAEIRRKHPGARILQIGPAGTRGVLYANVVNELSFFNGRNGLGAVMGSKNLRAVVLCPGRAKLPLPEVDRIREVASEIVRVVRSNPYARTLHELGTAAGVAPVNAAGALPTRNWTSSVFPGAEGISGERLLSQHLLRRHGCYACSIRCKRVVEIDSDQLQVDSSFGGPEYESLVSLGSLCGIGDLPAICKANELCNLYGMDTISTGATVAFAMECYEHGLVSDRDTGYALRFGDPRGLLAMIHDIAHRAGFGDVLAEGSFRAAGRIGGNASQYCHHVKRQELPMHDPRSKAGMALQFALSPRGADHWIAQHDPYFVKNDSPGVAELRAIGIAEPTACEALGPSKARQFLYTQFLCGAYDMLGVCTLAAVARSAVRLDQILEVTEAATGWKTSWFEILKASERVINLVRLLNLREGIDHSADSLPGIFFRDFSDGPRSRTGAIDEKVFKKTVATVYGMSGWSESGVPLAGKLIELGLDDVDLARRGLVQRDSTHAGGAG